TVGDEISAAALGERVFHVPNVRGTTFLELDGVTLLDSGNSSAQGGCLLAESARVDLNNTTFDGCAASDGGGAAFVDSDVTFSGSNLTSNEARQGGGVYAENTVLAVTTSSVQSNSAFDGGGLFVLGDGHAVIKESLIHDNVAERAGGGAWIQMATTGIETAIHDNQAIYGGGALVFDAPFVGTQVNVFDNNASRYGGGFYGHQRAEIELDHSSLYGNWGSTGGGGIYTLSLAYLYNSTVHENSAFYGAAVQSVGGSSFVFGNNVSIADNQHLGFIGFAIEGPTIRLRNSIVERHFASCSPSVDSIGYVVSTDNNCLSGGAPGNLSGPANTVAQTVGTERRLVLQPGSIAIDVGNTASCESDDQRFLSRPQGLSCDAGAYELEN
ncbi:MAG: choice-of-anchor Q domain-containing protein, partial [Myxococcota bacterium]